MPARRKAPRVPTLPPGRILVTGGAGFIGSAVIWALNRRGRDDIVVTDFLGQDDKWRNLRALRFHEYIEADRLRALLRERPRALGRISAVVHLGACSATTERNAAWLVDNNVEYTLELARWALGHGVRFVYASSAATYGDGARGMEDDDARLDRLRPLNMYGYSKHLVDLRLRREGMLRRCVGLKYFNVFGPNEGHKGDMRSLVHKAYGQILETGSVRLFRSHRPDYRDGEQQRDFLYVKDAVEATLHFVEAARPGGTYNVGSGVASTWIELAQAIFAALGREPRIEFIDMPVELRDRYQYHTCADIGKLRAAGFTRPMTPLADAVADYVRNHLVPGVHLGDEPGGA